MRTGKRILALLMTAVMLFSIAGCKKTKKSTGAKSVEELVTKIIDTINKGKDYKEIEDWMDWDAWVVLSAMPDLSKQGISFVEMRDVVEDIGKGKDLDYITKNHKAFIKAWEEEKGHSFSEEDYDKLLKQKKELDEFMAESDVIAEFKPLAPYDDKYSESNNRLYDSGDCGCYSIDIDDEDYHALEIHYYIKDGKYIGICINFVG
ncbi:MAG: hypothetical protein J5752_11445 [Clostridiales bacterium]|nr:hypothetical protein [Clostridiales bacterium]